MSKTHMNDILALLHRIHWTYAHQRIQMTELTSCWNPGGPNRPWSEDKVSSVVSTAVQLGYCTMEDGFTGTQLELTKSGIHQLNMKLVA